MLDIGLKIDVESKIFEIPRVIFTLSGNPKSEAVIEELRTLPSEGQERLVFESRSVIKEYFGSDVSRVAVALFDSSGRGHFTMHTQIREKDNLVFPEWARGVQWAVGVHSKCTSSRRCACQVNADFGREFSDRLGKGHFPWGRPRKNEPSPVSVELPSGTDEIVDGLNNGPDLASAIADKEYALELPTGSKISWIRVSPKPIFCDGEVLSKILAAFRGFENACRKISDVYPNVPELLFAGVTLPDKSVAHNYLFPRASNFSVARPDLHYTGAGFFASEYDEMPGGFAELVHLDNVYGINQDKWRKCFEWFTERGALLFVVSHKWSKCYIPEFQWLTEYLAGKGYPVAMITTDRMDEISFSESGEVFYSGEKIGTIWRQFPIFETEGKLADLVKAADNGLTRMIPEFAHYGNKAWFSIFRSHNSFFRREIPGEQYEILDELLPNSHLVLSPKCFPCEIKDIVIKSAQDLLGLAESERNELVLKVCGANTLSARSYGVFMGHGLKEDDWRKWINERFALRQPFIIQERLKTAVAHVPVKNLKRNSAELFGCRILIRPWAVGGELVSASACAVPSSTLRVHGRVDMAVLPIAFE